MPRVRVATVNCTLRSFALAIVGAEYVLRRLEPGTHRWEQFVTPLELAGFARAAGLRRQSLRGVVYDPFRRDWPAVSVRKHHRLLRRLPATSTTTPPPPHLP
jgi:2-polyprenyl-3-methyl-5-hydroxy-6-metoxy-1,4-benzoquinol methylase